MEYFVEIWYGVWYDKRKNVDWSCLSMIDKNEYKVLKTIKELNDLEHQSKECISDVILKGKIVASLETLEEYEVNEALLSLSKKELIVDIFHKENKYIYGASITDTGLCLLKHYKKLWLKNACKIIGGYIWQITIVVITVILTKYFEV